MEPNETIVEEELDNEAEDILPDEIVEEEPDESEDIGDFTETEEPQEPEEPDEPKATAKEPGYVKKRISEAVEKAIARTRAEMQAMFDEQMAPIREKMIEDEAQELVRSRKVADIETARELVRFRKGLPNEPVAQATPQPRNEKGQFTPSKDNAKTEARIEMLQHQADRIKGNGGPDVIAEFQNNQEIKNKVISGEMDFYDVADYLKKKPSQKRPPSPVRSPNGASGNNNPNAIDSMSDEQFERMEKKISQGARIRLTK